MNYLITKSLNLKLFIFALFYKPCSIEYLFPLNNPILKTIKFILEKNKKINFKRVKMGQIKNKDGENLYGLSDKEVNDEIFLRKKEIYEKSNNTFLNVNSDIVLTHVIWKDSVRNNLIKKYFKFRKINNKKDKFYLFLSRNSESGFSKSINKIKNVFLIESLRLIFITLKIFFLLINFRKKGLSHEIIKCENLFLCNEDWPELNSQIYLRNQLTLSENLSGERDFVVIDSKNKKIYINKKERKIKFGPLNKFFEFLEKELPSFREYYFIDYQLRIKYLLINLKIIYVLWNLTRNIRAKKFIFNYFSSESASLIIIANRLKAKSYIYQATLQRDMYPDLHNPYTSTMSFTKKNEEMFLKRSYQIKNSFIDPKRIKYPYNSQLNYKRIKKSRDKFNKKFDLTIAYFDENYPTEKLKDKSEFHVFREDLKQEIKLLLEYAKKNPRVVFLSKSKYIAFKNEVFNPLNLIENDSELRTIYNPDQFVEIAEKSPFSNKNIISPREIGMIADICISTSLGGTAVYEAASVGCRALLFNSKMSVYDQIIPKNVLFDSLEEILLEISKISSDRIKLKESNLGIFDTNLLN